MKKVILNLVCFLLLLSSPVKAQSLVNLSKIEITGNTVFQTKELEKIVEPYLNKPLLAEEIINIRIVLTELYISKGYLNSGAFLPEQDISDGILEVQIVEGDLAKIEINQTRYTNAQRLERQLRSRIGTPFNVNQLESVLERLRRQPTVDSVKASLSTGTASGLSILELNIKENSPASVILQVNNYNTPGFGEWQGNIAFNHESLLGIEDQLTLQYGITEGSDNWGAIYSIPLNLQDTRLEVSYVEGDSEIIEAPFADLNINSNSESFSVGFTHPLLWKPDEEFNIGISLDLQESETFLFEDQPFTFSEGAEDGKSKVTALRLRQDWIKSTSSSVFALNSEFSFGLGIFGATVHESLPDSQFFTWRGQIQWLKAFDEDRDIVSRIRLATQLTPSDLLSQEKFDLGGIRSVRGYESSIRTGDNGFVATGELQFSLLKEDWLNLSLIPFIDFGKVWNNSGTNINSPRNLASVGLGLNLEIEDWLRFRVNYGIPLIDVDEQGNSLQANGWNFLLQVKVLRF